MTQDTSYKQFIKFVALVVQNLPELESAAMKYLIDNPTLLGEQLGNLGPTLDVVFRFISNDRYPELIELDPFWDFMVLHSSEYPELGVAVSKRSGSCGSGLRLIVETTKGPMSFVAPCGCCGWHPRFLQMSFNDNWGIVSARYEQRIREVCGQNRITHLVFHCHKDALKQEVNDLILIDPYNSDEMDKLDKVRFDRAFSMLKVKRDEELIPLTIGNLRGK